MLARGGASPPRWKRARALRGRESSMRGTARRLVQERRHTDGRGSRKKRQIRTQGSAAQLLRLLPVLAPGVGLLDDDGAASSVTSQHLGDVCAAKTGLNRLRVLEHHVCVTDAKLRPIRIGAYFRPALSELLQRQGRAGCDANHQDRQRLSCNLITDAPVRVRNDRYEWRQRTILESVCICHVKPRVLLASNIASGNSLVQQERPGQRVAGVEVDPSPRAQRMAAVVHGAAARPKGERIDSRVGASRGQRGESTPSLTLGNGMLAGLVTRQVEPDSHGIGIWIGTCSKCVVDASHSSREFLVGRGPLACFSRGDVLRTLRIPGPRAIGSMHHGGIGLRAQATRGALRWQRRQVQVGWRHGRTADCNAARGTEVTDCMGRCGGRSACRSRNTSHSTSNRSASTATIQRIRFLPGKLAP